ncbi:phage holin [Bacillus sp. T33-2]|uniref:phage holin n=1 Tax=Bacillus sp. T33-2 TaxID=2054168 RepID=UPI000C78C098|nr:phage holin [Bacillus sp. T33-2]PLR93182.1 phage holin [Bacillus sp. T33-2]
MINWKVRFSNKLWVAAFVSQLFVLAEVLLVGAHAAGLTDWQLTEEVKGWVLTLINAIFGVLATLGVVQDPTTEGLEDSARAKRYTEPQ